MVLLIFKSIILFIAIALTVSIIDNTIENILKYGRLSNAEFDAEKFIKGVTVVPVSGTGVTIVFWILFYILSSLK